MNVLLLNPPFLGKFSREQRSPAVTKSGTLYYPMWLCYAAGVLEDSGFRVKLVDAPAAGTCMDEVLKCAADFQPSLAVVDTSTPSIENDFEAARRIKDILPECKTVLVGPHVSACPEETLSLGDGVDMVARGEYEFTLLEVARALEGGRAPYGASGLSFRIDSEIRHNPGRPLPDDLDSIPFVSRSYKRHLRIEDYFYAHSQYPIVTTITGRGCPHRCVYCVYPQTFSSHKYRKRSVVNIADEVEYILKEFPQAREVMFEDDTLTVGRKRCRDFCEEILRREIRFSWSANSRCDVDLKTLKLMRRAGCRLLCVGVESGDQGVLDRMHKHLTLDRAREFMKDTRRAGIMVHGCFMVGNPGDTPETLKKTLEFAKELNPDTAQFFPIMVYPGTEAYAWAESKGYLKAHRFSEWLTEKGLHNCVVDFPNLSSRDMVEFCDRARREFYMRPSYIARKLFQAARDPREGKRIVKSARTFAKYLVGGTFGERRAKEERCS
jgi:anaerobic magnesium-protoporphyrin IX monomethyl ester cyclase